MSTEIQNFVSLARNKGLSDQEIFAKLREVGWEESVIKQALSLGSELQAPPVPKTFEEQSFEPYKHFSNPAYSIVYIISFILLLNLIYNAIVLLNNISDFFWESGQNATSQPTPFTASFPDQCRYDVIFDSAAFSLAMLSISLPLYLSSLFFLRHYETKRAVIRKSWSRKVSYLLIIINCFVFVVGAPVWLVYVTLNGSFSLGVLLKFLSSFTINLIPLIYYFLQLKDDKKILK